jgi:D-glycero-D-manno-heptose 1,7-bisphosphate phosphatase
MPSTKAVFLDRDGVLNAPTFNPKTNQHEAPHRFTDLTIFPDAFPSIRRLQDQFQLFVISNQPDYALGKATLEDLQEVADGFAREALNNKVKIQKYYYCHHHPHGVVPDYTLDCPCRKPKSYFLEEAAKSFHLDLKASWMVGDRDTDIQCGKHVGCRTILVENIHGKDKQGREIPTARAANIKEAVELILKGEKN